MLRPLVVWLWDNSGSAYVDLTDNVRTDTDFNFLSDANDKLYVGLDRRYIGLYSDLTTLGSYAGIAYEYIRSTEVWRKLSLIDSAYAFNVSKYQRWLLPDDWIKFNFTATNPHAATPPDNIERYWIRVYASTVTTTAVIDKLRLIPYAEYTTPRQVAESMQLKNDFDYIKNPTIPAVERMIRGAEDRVDYRTKKSWRFNAVTEETDAKLVDFNRYGFFLRHRNFAKVYSVQMWNGAAWDTLTDGRANDYFVNYDLGIVYMTRMFLLPAVYGMAGRYTQYSYGEFKNAIRVDYIYGRNSETDREFAMVERLANKMVAVEILRHHDYSSLVVSGSDKIPLDSKVQNLEQEIEMQLDELTGVSVY